MYVYIFIYLYVYIHTYLYLYLCTHIYMWIRMVFTDGKKLKKSRKQKYPFISVSYFQHFFEADLHLFR